ncbi:MAG: DUF429 domain-containing protein [Pseudomonadota bacterium]
MSVQLIGVDCAVNPKDIGIAVGHYFDAEVEISQLIVGRPRTVETIASVVDPKMPTLFAFDSPLGWPQSLAERLADHQAGTAVGACPNHLFRRTTDRFIRHLVGKQPLEVGADRIARTAVASLNLIAELEEALGSNIPLVWSPAELSSLGCIEVYPAATLEACKLSSRGYKGKKPENFDARSVLLESLSTRFQSDSGLLAEAKATDHGLDAMVCCLAAVHFLEGSCPPPQDLAVARREGWIWVKLPGSNSR